MSAESRASNARIKKALREHKSVLRRQKQSQQPVGLAAMADDWDRGLVINLRSQPDHMMLVMRLVNMTLKGCHPVCRADKEMVKRDILRRIPVLRRAGIVGYVRRRFLKLLVECPPVIFKPFDPATLPEPDLDYGH